MLKPLHVVTDNDAEKEQLRFAEIGLSGWTRMRRPTFSAAGHGQARTDAQHPAVLGAAFFARLAGPDNIVVYPWQTRSILKR